MTAKAHGAARLGYDARDRARLREIGRAANRPEELARVIDGYDYIADWRRSYRIQSVRSSLHGTKVTCIDAAILAYGLLEVLFPDVTRRLLAIHRRDPATGEECGHCVTLYRTGDGKVGAFSKSSYPGLGHREAIHGDEESVARTYALAYRRMGFDPLYFGVTTLEEAAPDVDWRCSREPINVVSERLQERYAWAFG